MTFRIEAHAAGCLAMLVLAAGCTPPPTAVAAAARRPATKAGTISAERLTLVPGRKFTYAGLMEVRLALPMIGPAPRASHQYFYAYEVKSVDGAKVILREEATVDGVKTVTEDKQRLLIDGIFYPPPLPAVPRLLQAADPIPFMDGTLGVYFYRLNHGGSHPAVRSWSGEIEYKIAGSFCVKATGSGWYDRLQFHLSKIE